MPSGHVMASTAVYGLYAITNTKPSPTVTVTVNVTLTLTLTLTPNISHIYDFRNVGAHFVQSSTINTTMARLGNGDHYGGLLQAPGANPDSDPNPNPNLHPNANLDSDRSVGFM